MATQAIHYETLRDGLVLVKFIGWTEREFSSGFNAKVEVVKTKPPYVKGENLTIDARSIVVKAGTQNGYLMVKPAILPVRTDDNTLLKIWG